MENNRTSIIVSSVVMLILLVAFAIPITAGMSDTISHSKEVTSGRFYVNTNGIDEDVTFTYDTDNHVLINGEPINYLNDYTSCTNVILANADTFNFYFSGSHFDGYCTNSTVNPTAYKQMKSFTIKNDGTYSYLTTDSDTPATGTYGELYAVATNTPTEYVAVWNSVPAVDKNAVMYAAIQITLNDSQNTSHYAFEILKGTYDNLELLNSKIVLDGSWVSGNAATYTYNAAVSEHDKYVEVTTSGTITVTVGSEDYSKSANSTYFIPDKYHTLEGNDAMMVTLIGLVPILLAVSVIMAVMYSVVTRNKD